MKNLQGLLNRLKMSPIKVIPHEFDMMIESLSHISKRQEKLKKFEDNFKSGKTLKAFYDLCKVLKPSEKDFPIHNSVKSRNLS